MQFSHTDGGRSRYYSQPDAGDCVIRAIAVAMQKDYRDVWRALTARSQDQGLLIQDPRLYKGYIQEQGWLCRHIPPPHPRVRDISDAHAIVYCVRNPRAHMTAIVAGECCDSEDWRDADALMLWHPPV
jgi:hypothetical protein